MKWPLLTFLFVFTTKALLAQDEHTFDSLKVDRWKRALSHSKEDTTKVNLYSNLSWAYVYANADTALSYALPGLTLARKLDFKRGEIWLMNMVGEALLMKGNLPKSLEIKLEALQKAEKLNDPERLANCHNFLAENYLESEDYSKALFYIHKIKANEQEFKKWKKFVLAGIGLCYIHLNNLDSAFYYTKQAYEIDRKDKAHWAMIYHRMGTIYEKKGDYNKALDFYKEGNQMGEDINSGYLGIASVFNKTGKQDSAIYHAKKVLEDGIKGPNFHYILGASNLLTEIYKSKGDTIRAFIYQQLMLATKDSLLSQEKVKHLQNLSFNEEQRQQEILLQQQAYHNRLKLYTLLALGALVVGGVLLKFQAHLKTKQLESDKLRELDSLKSHFFANISHEFRTPLSLIAGTVEKLRKNYALSADEPDYAIISRNSERLLELINQLLDISKLEAGKLEIHKQPGEIIQFLKVLLSSFASLFESKGIGYLYHLPLSPLPAKYDWDKLEKIITNLLSNAYKFTPQQGKIVFSVEVLEKTPATALLQIKVQDSGIGIAEQELPRIFDRFHQADASPTRAYEGTGIGLALVKELVELLGGQICVESTQGKGTLFTIHFPIELLSAEEAKELETDFLNNTSQQPFHPEEEASTRETLPATGKPTSTLQVLVVEDNADLRNFVRHNLSKEYLIVEAQDGLEGYHKAVETIPDLIISDVMMPQMDGITLCKKLKTDERTSHIPLILLTAKADLETKLKGFETGADDYLIKPFKLEELQVRAKNLIDSRKKLRERFSKHLSLDPKEITVTSTDEKFLQRILDIVETNMANSEFDVETFSREIGMSRAHLHRKLTALTDQSANEFIKTIRLKRAASLLRQQHGNVSEVAYQVGFSSLNYFTKCFRECYGQTPSEYVRTTTPSNVNHQ